MARFEIIETQKFDAYNWMQVIRDKQTGVTYLYKGCGDGGGLTVLVDKDGKPLIATGKE